jgi:hypothetical protein
MKTAMEELIYELELDGYQFDNNVLEKYVEKEKQQIMVNWIDGKESKGYGYSVFGDASIYYEKKYVESES